MSFRCQERKFWCETKMYRRIIVTAVTYGAEIVVMSMQENNQLDVTEVR